MIALRNQISDIIEVELRYFNYMIARRQMLLDFVFCAGSCCITSQLLMSV